MNFKNKMPSSSRPNAVRGGIPFPERKRKGFLDFARNDRMLIIILIAIALVITVIRLISGEDDWICVEGKWTQHGKPNSPMPTGFCEAEVIKK